MAENNKKSNSDHEDKKQISNTKNTSQELNNKQQKEIGGQKGPEPTRYGDWEKNGRCTDF